MKILYFWVTRVIQTTIPSILSNIFQEATRCYITKPEKYTGYWYTTVCASIHPLFATYCVLRCTMKNDRLNSSFTYTGMTVLVSVGLDWHKKNPFFPVIFSSEMQWSSFLSGQLTTKTPQTLGLSGTINTYLWTNPKECSCFSTLHASSNLTIGKNIFLSEHFINIFCSHLHIFPAATTLHNYDSCP